MTRSSSSILFGIFVAVLALFLVFALIASTPDGFVFESFFRNYPGLIVAMASGFFGATFSMLIQSRKRASEGSLEDLNAAANWTTLTVRGSVGLGAAAILYFFFRSGLLDGHLWPDLHELGFDGLGAELDDGAVDTRPQLVPNEDLCLLIIWCFIAGFSETFVPNILAQTEKRSEPT